MDHDREDYATEEFSRPLSEINTTPLVDVMLVLLVIFIVTAPLLTHRLNIKLPQVTTNAVEYPPEAIRLSVNELGEMYWNDTSILKAELPANFKAIAQKSPQPEIHIHADKSTKFEILASVIADAQNAGVGKVGFVTSPQNTVK